MRKLGLAVALLALMISSSGCFSMSWAHNRRHVRKVIEEIIELHQDFDKAIFDLERNPTE